MLDHRLLLVTGKGGTGRSAVTAALALDAARRGRRVLALAFDDGAGLASHLAAPALTAQPVRSGDVSVARVDPAAALDEYLHLRIALPRVAAAGRVFAAVADTVPGVRDTVMIGKVLYEATRADWDVVVVEGPPTGQIESYLRAPAAIAALAPGGAVRRQAEWMAGTLREVGALVVVATPDELPVMEARELIAGVVDGVVRIGSVVANRAVPDIGVTPGAARTESDPMRRAAAEHDVAVRTHQARHLETLAADVVLPLLFGVHRPAEVAARLAIEWSRR